MEIENLPGGFSSEEEMRAYYDQAASQGDDEFYGGAIRGEKMAAEREREYRKRQRTMASWTMVPTEGWDPLVEDKDKAEAEHEKKVEQHLEYAVSHVADGTVPMYVNILNNRRLAYQDNNALAATKSQFEAIAKGALADENRWLDTPEGKKYRGTLMLEARILDGERVVLKSLEPFTLLFHGWNNLLGALQSRERGYDPQDPETGELAYVFNRGVNGGVGRKNKYEITEVGVGEADLADTEELFVPENEKKLAKYIDEAHRWYVAIAAVDQGKNVGDSEGIGQILTNPREALIKDMLVDRHFSVKWDEQGGVSGVVETEEIANVFSIKQQADRIDKVQRFIRACLSLGVWEKLSNNGLNNQELEQVKGQIREKMLEMEGSLATVMKGTLRDPYLLEAKGEVMSLAIMRGWGLGSLLGSGIQVENKYRLIRAGEVADKTIKVPRLSGIVQLELKLEGSEKTLAGGDTRSAGGDWDVRYPLMLAANTAYKAWNEGRLGLLGDEVERIKGQLDRSFDREDLKLYQENNLVSLPANLAVSFMEWAKFVFEGKKQSVFDLFLKGMPLYDMPLEVSLRSNEYYKWLIQLSQAKLVYEVVFSLDDNPRQDSAWEKYVAAPQGLKHLVKRVSLAVGHDKDEAEIWMAGLTAMMYAQKIGMLAGSNDYNLNAGKQMLKDMLLGIKGLNWRGDAEWGKRVADKAKALIDKEKTRQSKRL